ncbi:Cache sensor-containing signal transduction protein [Aliarcobacter cibarius]|uniref:cache domain-containing protein n=1 Tax=Aliarcobacter cibarius TaxID=255507 RepID=UPI0012A12C0C|nr:cache domain-containing protein [Aliarcobacter cibarius]QEZ89439.1 Cache sensor-containing signal transduction protein [Aliarcobacter cibarius]
MIPPIKISYKKFLISFLILISILLFFLNRYNTILNQKELDIFVSNQMKIVEDELENQKKQALSLALIFSKNQDIVKNLDDNNPKELKKELLKLLEIIKTYTNQDIDVQIHTKNLEVFTRSWEDKDFGENLTSFRERLVKVKSSNKPFVSNELGKRFNVKAIAPIYDKNNEFLGSIEIIIDFKDFIYRLKNLGISSMILLEKDFLNIATSYRENKHIEEFVLLQNSFDKFNKELIKEVLNSDKLFIEQDSKIYSKIPLGNFGNKNAGVLVVCFEKFVKNFVYLPNYNYHGEFNLNDSERKYNNINKEIIIK